MNKLGTFSTIALAAILVFVAANWSTIKLAWKYREQLDAVAAVAGDLQTMGLVKS